MLHNNFQKHVHDKMKKYAFRVLYFIFLFFFILIIAAFSMDIFLVFFHLIKSSAAAEAFYWRYEYPCRYTAFVTNYLFELFAISEPIRNTYFKYWWVDYCFQGIFDFMNWYLIKVRAIFMFPFFYIFNILVPLLPREAFFISAESDVAKIAALHGISLEQLNDYVIYFFLESSPFAWFKLTPVKIIVVILLIYLLNYIHKKVSKYI